MPLQATSGAASYDGFGGGVAAVPNYIEECFSTTLYTGTGSAQTITNGIDLAGEGGLVWLKARNVAKFNGLIDTVRGVNSCLVSSSTSAQNAEADSGISSFNSTGFTLNAVTDFNGNTNTLVSWTFRKQPKFFDVVTYTGNSVAGREIAHNLGSVPGCMIVKSTSDAQDWAVYHRSLGNTKRLVLNGTDAEITSTVWNNTTPTSTVFTVSDNARVNSNGSTYVAYIYAHDAGGFGLTGTDNVISCGSFDANDGEVINLGYEPQWLFYKDSVSVSNWRIADTMRGLTNLAGTNAQTIQQLVPNSSAAESANSGPVLTSTGFTWNQSGGGNKHIYIAIRRGPMKVPTSGTSVFAPSTGVEPSSSPLFTAGFSDMTLHKGRIQSTYSPLITDRLRGKSIALYTSNTNAEQSLDPYFQYDSNAGAFIPAGGYFNNAGGGSDPYALYAFRRAPSFFDEVCYTGTGNNLTVNHNLGVAPEIVIIKRRSSAASNNNWYCGWNMNASTYMEAILNTSDAGTLYSYPNWFTSAPTSTTFAIAGGGNVNANTATYVAYLFATCAGVSKVGSYTGTGTTLQVDCGFTGGSRFVLIKRTDSTGSWYVWDVARGISSGNDPYLLLNSTAAEVTNTDYIDAYSAGFEISSTAPAEINASGGSFIFLAIS